jgi:hypothetical protein
MRPGHRRRAIHRCGSEAALGGRLRRSSRKLWHELVARDERRNHVAPRRSAKGLDGLAAIGRSRALQSERPLKVCGLRAPPSQVDPLLP